MVVRAAHTFAYPRGLSGSLISLPWLQHRPVTAALCGLPDDSLTAAGDRDIRDMTHCSDDS